ncbi:hypothetical protein ADUPG1_010475, partial [Aduncisulcus paluster]
RGARRDSELLELVAFEKAPETLEEIAHQAKKTEEKAKEVEETPERKELREKTLEVEALRLKMAELEDFKRNAELEEMAELEEFQRNTKLEEISKKLDELDSSEKRKAEPPTVKGSKPIKEDSMPDDGKTVHAEGVSSAFNWMDNSDARFKRLEDAIVSLQKELALARREKLLDDWEDPITSGTPKQRKSLSNSVLSTIFPKKQKEISGYEWKMVVAKKIHSSRVDSENDKQSTPPKDSEHDRSIFRPERDLQSPQSTSETPLIVLLCQKGSFSLQTEWQLLSVVTPLCPLRLPFAT